MDKRQCWLLEHYPCCDGEYALQLILLGSSEANFVRCRSTANWICCQVTC